MKNKLSVIIIAIMAILMAGILAPLLNHFSGLTVGLNIEAIRYMADAQVNYWKGREDAYMQTLHALENNNLTAQERQNIYNKILEEKNDIELIQERLEEELRYSDAIAMAVYANDGTILGSYVPDRVGKNMRDVDTIYGEYIQDAFEAVQKGWDFQCSAYSPVLRSNVEIIIVPYNIGNPDTTRSIMIAASEDYMLLETRQMARFTLVLAIVGMLAAAVIIFVVVRRMVPNMKPEKWEQA